MGDSKSKEEKPKDRIPTREQSQQIESFNELVPDCDTKKCPKYDFENLVFEGGGQKGIAFIAALKYLERRGISHNIKGICGSSSGSIIATMFTLGYTADEMLLESMAVNTQEFMDGSFIPIGKKSPLNTFGLYLGENLFDYFSEIIWRKTDSPSTTFEQLYEKTGKHLSITGTNISRRQSVYFSHLTYPKMEIRQALRISTSVPFLFAAVEFDGDLWADGGMLANYPIHYFDKDTSNNGERAKPADPKAMNFKTLGFRMVTNEEREELTKKKGVKREIDGLLDYAVQILDTFQTSIEKQHLRHEDWIRTISVQSGDISDTDLHLAPYQKDFLFRSGIDGCNRFFIKYDIIARGGKIKKKSKKVLAESSLVNAITPPNETPRSPILEKAAANSVVASSSTTSNVSSKRKKATGNARGSKASKGSRGSKASKGSRGSKRKSKR